MIFDPLFPIVTICWLLVPPALLLGWQLVRSWTRGWSARWQPIRRIGVLLLLAAAAVGPAVPGALTKVVVSDVDVFLVMDTTTSSNAEDYGPDGGTRLDAMKADARLIAAQYAGARYSIITFDNGSLVRLPLVADPTALDSALDTLEVEVTQYSGGSSISEARDTVLKRLTASQSAHPERLRLVFYFGDGEQTRDSDPESFSDSRDLISDGAVLGYGTASGGPMRENDYSQYSYYGDQDPDAGSPPAYVVDTSQSGSPRAISKIDEDNLKTVASDLGVSYQHRDPQTEPSFPDIEDRIGEEILVPEVAIAARYYWVPILPAFLLLLWDLVIAARQIGDLRRAKPRSGPVAPARAPAGTPNGRAGS